MPRNSTPPEPALTAASEKLSLQQRIARLAETPQQYHQRRQDAYHAKAKQLEAEERAAADARSDREEAQRATWRVLTLDPATGTAVAEASWTRSRVDAQPGYKRSRFGLVARPAGNVDKGIARVLMLGSELEVLEES